MSTNIFLAQALYERLGRPAWFWPALACALLLVWGLAGALD